MSLLELEGLRKEFRQGAHTVAAVRDVTLSIEPGETLGLVGESGCGKTTLGRVVVGLTDPTRGEIRFDGKDLTKGITREHRRRVQMVFQHPAQSLNPRMRVEEILAEPLRLLTDVARSEIPDRIAEALRLVGLGPEYAARRPRSLSGGQQQRVAIARALICEPDLVILDEPTSSLDQSVRSRIVALLDDIQASRGVAYLFISHDLATVGEIADRVAVMYLGRVVELAATDELFGTPRHPYARALLSAVPKMDPAGRRERIILPGETPSPSEVPPGCSFQHRCHLAFDRCREEFPVLQPIVDRHFVECFAAEREASPVPLKGDQAE